ncbi:DUF3971 domain-containing protein [Nitrospira moscoviensis]|uniref:AsmA-like C-terminal domain-containing protein n=1 Tax=Nitrospira moscoviensis TaxID=42253 RepID=A0A0K2GE62_NITMO|nr:DUF3971 domain-containing protein [Nitrospira moscoviensis]ALA59149.1 hypothetical protein NITMOv2_2739 [Nitrospira moscoviensis]
MPSSSLSRRPAPRWPPERGDPEAASPVAAVPPAGARPRRRLGAALRWLFGLTLLVAAALALLLPLVSDIVLKPVLLDQLEQWLDRDVEAERLRLSLFPLVRLEFTGVAVRDPGSSEPVFRAGRVELALPLWPLLRRRHVDAERVVIESPWLLVQRDRAGRWRVPFAGAMDRTPPKPPSDESRVLPVNEIRLMQGTVTVVDESRSDGSTPFTISDLQASLSFDSVDETAAIRVSAVLPAGGPLSTFTLLGRLAPVEPDGLAEGLPSFRFDGAGQAAAVDLRRIATWFLPPSQAEALTGTAHVAAQWTVAPGPAGYDARLHRFEVEAGAVALGGSGRATGLGSEEPGYELAVASSPVTIEQLLAVIPMEWLPPRWQELVAAGEPGGTVELLGATIRAPANDGAVVAGTGELALLEGRFLMGPQRIPVQDLSARIVLDTDRVSVEGLTGSYGPVQVMNGALVLSDLRRAPRLDFTATGEAAAMDLAALLPAVVPSPTVGRVLSAVEEIDGDLDFVLRLAGPLSGGGVQLVEADVTARDVGFRAGGLPLPVRHLNGRVVIMPDHMEVQRLHGRLGTMPVEMAGRIALGDVPRWHDVVVRAEAEMQELVDRFLPGGRAAPLADGPARLMARLSGPVAAPQIVGRLDLDEAAIAIDGVVHKPQGAPASVEVAADLSRERRLAVKKFDLVLPPARLSARGSIHLAGAPTFALSIRSHPLAVGRLPAWISLGPLTDGRLSAAVDIKGRGTDWTTWRMNGGLRLDGGVAIVDRLAAPVRALTVGLTFDQDRIRIDHAGGTLGASDLRLSGLVRSWKRTPLITVDVTSSGLDVSGLMAQDKHDRQTSESGRLPSWIDDLDLTASLAIVRVSYESLRLIDVACRLRIEHGIVRIERFKAGTDPGRIGGWLAVEPQERRTAAAEGSLRLSGVPIRSILGLTGEGRDGVTGRLSLRGQAHATLRDLAPAPETVKSQGDIPFSIEDGRIKGLPLVAGLLKIVNLPALVQGRVNLEREGLPFDRITGVLSVERGIVTVKQLYLDGPALKISASGEYDLAADQLDLAMAASPLQSYSNFLRNLPLIGRLFAGERRGFGTTLFAVKGSLGEPEIQTLPAATLASGLMGFGKLAYDILLNAVTLPADLFTQADAAEEEEPGSGRKALGER